MYYRFSKKLCRPNVWSNIDPLKVKQRIDTITERLEEVRRQFESESEAGNSLTQKQS